MAILKAGIWVLLLAGAALFALTQYLTMRIESRFPPAGRFRTISGTRIHYIEEPARRPAELLPMVFIHGAGGNSRDMRSLVPPAMVGRGRMIFVDRPGAGYSQRGDPGNASPERQAALIGGLMAELDIREAVIVGHSYGGAVGLALALSKSQSVAGLILVAPASHAWPGGKVTWYYRIASLPFVGRLFSSTVAVPVGNLLYSRALRSIFSPDPVPSAYSEESGTRLVLRPASFLHNARDITALHDHVEKLSRLYREINVPTTIITGDSDTVVSPQLHAERLEGELANAKLVVLENTGHMPVHIGPDVLVKEIEQLNRRISREVALSGALA